MTRLRRDQRLDDEAGIESDRVRKQELVVLDREDASRGGPAPA
jgi:hypothetical protein